MKKTNKAGVGAGRLLSVAAIFSLIVFCQGIALAQSALTYDPTPDLLQCYMRGLDQRRTRHRRFQTSGWFNTAARRRRWGKGLRCIHLVRSNSDAYFLLVNRSCDLLFS